MMKQTFQLATLLLLLLGLPAADCQARKGSDEQLTTVYSHKDFTALQVGGIAEVHFTQGDHYDITVEESSIPALKTVVEKNGQTLVVKTETVRKRRFSYNRHADAPVVRITAPQLNGISVDGAARIDVNSLQAGGLSLKCSGASKAHLVKTRCKALKVNASGASHLTADAVTCTSLGLNSSGACHVKMAVAASGDATLQFSGAANGKIRFTGQRIGLDSSGAGNLELTVDCKQLKARNSGAAKVSISGTADEVSIDASGVSKINTSELNQF